VFRHAARDVEARTFQPGRHARIARIHDVGADHAPVGVDPVARFIQGRRRHAQAILLRVVCARGLDEADGRRGKTGEATDQTLDDDTARFVDRSDGIDAEGARRAVDQHLARVARDLAMLEHDAVGAKVAYSTETYDLLDALQRVTLGGGDRPVEAARESGGFEPTVEVVDARGFGEDRQRLGEGVERRVHEVERLEARARQHPGIARADPADAVGLDAVF